MAKNQAKTKQQPEAEILLFENYSLFSLIYHPELIWNILKNLSKTKCVCFNNWDYMIYYNENEDENDK